MAGAKAIDPEKDSLLTSAISKSMADIKVKESKNSEAISQDNGMKKTARRLNNLISPAPIPARRMSGARSKTHNPDIGCKSRWVNTLSESRNIRLKKSTRLEMR
jgi:hypothetical protein